MEFDWVNLLQVLGGMILGGGGVFGIKSSMRKAKTDADKAEIERLHLQIDHQQKSLEFYIKMENDNAVRIAELNKGMDGKTDQIRKLTEQVIASEHGRNADKEDIARLTAELGEAQRQADYHKLWRCERTDCQDPRGPKPPRKDKGMKYDPPRPAK